MDGVSTMQNYHAQFQRIVRESSYTQLASQLRTKLGLSAVGAQVTPIPIAAAAAAPGRDAVRVPGNHRTDRSRASGDRAGRRRGRHARPGRERRRAVRTGESTWRGAHAGRTRREARVPSHPRLRRPRRSGRRRLRLRSGPCRSPPTHRRSRCNRTDSHTGARSGRQCLPAVIAPTSSAPAPGDTAYSGHAPAPAALPTPATPATPSVVATAPALATPVKQPAPRVNGATPIHSGSGSAFWVQVGAYRDTVDGRSRGQGGQRRDPDRRRVVARGDSRRRDSPLLRVRVGPFVERTQAVSRARDLQALGYKPFIVAGE